MFEGKERFIARDEEEIKIPEKLTLKDLSLDPERITTALLEDERARKEILPQQFQEKLEKAPNPVENKEIFEEVCLYIARVQENNEKAVEDYKEKVVPLLVEALKEVLGKFQVNVHWEKLNNLGIIFLDRYSDWYLRQYRKMEGGVTAFKSEGLPRLIFLRLEPIQKIFEKFTELGISIYLLHELLHFLSKTQFWMAITPDKEGFFLGTRRAGIRVKGKNDQVPHLHHLNEALTQKLTIEASKIFLEKYYFTKLLTTLGPQSREKITQRILQHLEEGYSRERKVLEILCQKIPFEMFVKAYFEKEGFLPLGRALERTLGKEGIRKLDELMAGENYQKIQELLKEIGFQEVS